MLGLLNLDNLNEEADTMQAAQAAGQVMVQSIGAYADITRDSALKDAKAAQARGDLDAVQTFLDTAESWDEGESNRVALHVIGGGVIDGRGGSGIGTFVL